MHYEIEVEGRLRRVIVRRAGDGFAADVDGRPWRIDAVRVDPHTLSLIIGAVPSDGDTSETTGLHGRADARSADRFTSGGRSLDVTVSSEPDGRLEVRAGATPFSVALNGRRRRSDEVGVQSGDGPQRVAAPMPGKIVRILVAPGAAVDARQPLIVVEAMKMENELRAGRAGRVAEIHVKEGASVEAGAPLIDIL